jgi:hypothetical protein
VRVLPTNSRRICAVRLTTDVIHLLMINFNMPYEGDANSTAEFADWLSAIETLVTSRR